MGGVCLFCGIVRGEVRSQKVYEDDLCLAFKDINPAAPTHILVVPKKHVDALSSCGEGDIPLLGHLQWAVREAARLTGIERDFRVVSNNGRGAGQSVDHLHYHVMGGRRFAWPPG